MNPPASSTYEYVVSRDINLVELLLKALNNVNVLSTEKRMHTLT